MTVQLVKEEDLKGLTKPWPMKDAADIWKRLQTIGSKDFNTLVLGYLTNTKVKNRRGRGTEIERLAKSILFEMSPKQRAIAYGIVEKRIDFLTTKGWWQDDLNQLCKAPREVTVNRNTHRSTGFNRTILAKKKYSIDDGIVVRIRFIELTSAISDYKEWMVTCVETDVLEENKITEVKFTDYRKAEQYYSQFSRS